jgi:hypothetical protein
VSASASGVVSGGSSNVASAAAADAEAVVVELVSCGGGGLRASAGEESKSTDADWESTSGRCCEKNWCRRRSGALSGGWDANAVGAAEGVGRASEEDAAVEEVVVVVPEPSSGKDEDVCCCCVSLLAVLVSTRVGDFAEALAGGTTLGGFDELKKRPPGGFEKREYDLLEEWCMGRRNLGNIVFLDCADKSRTRTVVGHVTMSAGTRDGRTGGRSCPEHLIGDTLVEPHPQYLYPTQATPHHPATLSTHPLLLQPRSLPLHLPLHSLQWSPQQKKPSLTSSPQRPASISFSLMN